MSDEPDPELVEEVEEALRHGLLSAQVERCAASPPHIHLANFRDDLPPGAPDNVGEVGLVVIGTVPDLPDEAKAEVAALFEEPCTWLLDSGSKWAREFKEEAVNDANGPTDLHPVLRVSWPTFATIFELGEYVEELELEHPSKAITLVHESMVRAFGPAIGAELVLDSWLYVPPEGKGFDDVTPGEAYQRGLPGAYEAMVVIVASPKGLTQRSLPYVYGGGNVEWITVATDLSNDRWAPWEGRPDGSRHGGVLTDGLRQLFGPPRVKAKEVSRKQRWPSGPPQ